MTADRVTADLWQPLPPTPVSELVVNHRSARHHLLIKHESHNRSGSVKDRTAIGLLRSLDAVKPLRPGTTIVESTSGNLGVALAQQLARLGCLLIAVIDPRTPAAATKSLQSAGACLHLVDEPDGHGGYLLSRLRVVRQLCAHHPDYRWTNQYENPANPDIHAQSTAPEILQQGGPDLDTVYVAVSTGGTLAGIARHIREQGRFIRLVAVDSYASLATAPPPGRSPPPRRSVPPGPIAPAGPEERLLTGIGASRRSSFLTAGSFDRRIAVRDPDAIAMCRILREDTAIGIGGSTGCVLNACLDELRGPVPPVRPLCLSADDATKYEDTVYDDAWLVSKQLHDQVMASVHRHRADGLSFQVAG